MRANLQFSRRVLSYLREILNSSLELTGKNKNVIKEKTGEVYKLFGFFFGGGKLVGRFVAQKSDVVRPVAHRFGEDTLLSEIVYSTFKAQLASLAVRKVKEFFEVNFQSPFKGGSTRHNSRLKGSGAKNNLCFFKYFSDIIRNCLLVINRRRFRDYRNDFCRTRIGFASFDVFKNPRIGVRAVRDYTEENAITAGTLGGDGNIPGILKRRIENTPRHSANARKNNFFAAIRTRAGETEHWR